MRHTGEAFRLRRVTAPMFWALGYTVYEVVTDTLMDEGKIICPDVQFVPTNFDYDYDDDFSTMVTALTEDAPRNKLINDKLLSEASAGHFCMVLSERVGHCYVLQALLEAVVPDVSSAVLVGSVSK